MDRLVVLGGSSPFSIALFDALSETTIAPHDLVLQGRNRANLDIVSRAATHRLAPLGWRIAVATDLAEALQGARTVVHQIRYGGLAGRAEDEALAVKFMIQPDETLGPAALQSLLRTLPGLRRVSEAIAEYCPEAWVLNLTNPLSATTSVMTDTGVARCVGLCELPLVTARLAAEVVGAPLEAIDWSYVGFNHRGFVVRFRHGNVDLLDELIARLGTHDLGGVSSAQIAGLRAIPTKYFAMFRRGRQPRGGRAARLLSLREEALAEIEADPEVAPSSLRKRYLEWYPQSVVPMIAALESTTVTEQIVNLPGEGGVTKECHARVSTESVAPLPPMAPGEEVTQWLDRFDVHERAIMDVARNPSPALLNRALETDPLVPGERVDALADAVWSGYVCCNTRIGA